MAFKNYRDLVVWRAGMQLTEDTYRLTTRFPRHETYGLTSQIRRSAISIPSNLAEGHTRRSTKEFLRFISVALGSLSELETQLILSVRLGYVGDADADPLLLQASEVGKMLHGLRNSLESRIALSSP